MNHAIAYVREQLHKMNGVDLFGIKHTSFSRVESILDEAEMKFGDNWIPCDAISHPNHSIPCEVTIFDFPCHRRELAYYSGDTWHKAEDNSVLDVIAWKEPSKPFIPAGTEIPRKIIWRGQGHEAEGLCPNCGCYLGDDQDLTFEPVEHCKRCGQHVVNE